MNTAAQIVIIKKLLVLLTFAVSLMQARQPMKLGAISGDDQLISDEEARQANDLQVFGQYLHVPETQLDASTSYTVNEELYPDKTRGYQILITHKITTMSYATTSAGQVIPSQMQRSVGFGEHAAQLTWTK